MTILFSLVILIRSQQNQQLEISVKFIVAKTYLKITLALKIRQNLLALAQAKKLSKFSDSRNRVVRFS